MEINFDFLNNLNGNDILTLFFKAFALVFSLMFVVYSLVVYRQVVTMGRTIQIHDWGPIQRQDLLVFLSLLEFFISVAILLFALFIVFL